MKDLKFSIPEVKFGVKISDDKPFNLMSVSCSYVDDEGMSHPYSISHKLNNENITIYEEVTSKMQVSFMQLMSALTRDFTKDFAFVESDIENDIGDGV